MASQITGVSTVYSTAVLDADQRKHQNSASLAFVWGIHQWPGISPHKGPVSRNKFPLDDVIMFPLQNRLDRYIVINTIDKSSLTGVIMIQISDGWIGHKPRQVSSNPLTHWGWVKWPPFSNTFSWTKMYEFQIRFHWSLFLRVKLTIFQHWFRQWPGADPATSHCLN